MTFESTLRAETNDVKEVQKADFDLLDKINRNSREVDSLVRVINTEIESIQDDIVTLTPITIEVTGNYTLTSTDSVVNVNTGTATITIPAGLPIGHTVTIRKISATAGTVTIARSGSEVITRTSQTSVRLTSNGDFWTLQKVTDLRWELFDGIERGTGWTAYPGGEMFEEGETAVQTASTVTGALFVATAGAAVTVTFPNAFAATPIISSVVKTITGQCVSNVIVSPSASSFTNIMLATASGSTGSTMWQAVGRWY